MIPVISLLLFVIFSQSAVLLSRVHFFSFFLYVLIRTEMIYVTLVFACVLTLSHVQSAQFLAAAFADEMLAID